MTNGYVIKTKFIPHEILDEIRNFWMKRFAKFNDPTRVTWAPYLGQPNTIGYSEDKFQCLYRACDFFWNEPIDGTTRNVCLIANELRNEILGDDPEYGTRYFDETGIFATASWYPPGKGFMQAHTDGVATTEPLIHVLVPITFRGIDYQSGGAFLINRQGIKIDIESRLRPGDVLLYDASLKHGVDRVEGGIGRLQVFPIPSRFTHLENNPHALGRITISAYGSAKWEHAKDALRRMAGKIPNWR